MTYTKRFAAVTLVAATAFAAAPLPEAHADEDNWIRVEGAPGETFDIAGSQDLGEVTATHDGGFVVVGTDWDLTPGGFDGAVWTSADGLAWTRRQEAAGGPFEVAGSQSLEGIAQAPNGVLVAAGDDIQGVGGDGDAAVWTSSDNGATWVRRGNYAGSALAVPQNQTLWAVAATAASDFVAVGADFPSGLGDAASWFSSDGGVTWSRLAHPSAPDIQYMTDITIPHTGPLAGIWLAVGIDTAGGSRPALWRYIPGISTQWVKAPVPSGSMSHGFDAVTTTPSGRVVAVGHIGNTGNGAIWVSDDAGETWAQRAQATFAQPGFEWLYDVEMTPAGLLVAVGHSNYVPAVWTSADNGETWTRQAEGSAAFSVPADTQLRGLAVNADGRMVASGNIELGDEDDGAIWAGLEPPAIAGIAPAGGPDAGGTEVVISGRAFTGTNQVLFGASPAASFTVISDTQLLAVSPPGSGTVGIAVSTADGMSADPGAANDFAYGAAFAPGPPVVSGLSPAMGPVTGGTQVTITGMGFSGATEVRFGERAASFTVASDVRIEAVAPTAFVGVVQASVITPLGTSPDAGAADDYTYLAASGGPFLCPETSTPFTDIAGNFAAADIACLYGHGITTGTTSTTYSPGAVVTREQMAVFLMKMFEAGVGGLYVGDSPSPFTDLGGSFAATRIGQLFSLGATAGTGPTVYTPSAAVTREQMAVFLVRIYEGITAVEPPAAPTAFTDTAASYAATEIAQLAHLGITAGTSATTYGLHDVVTRDQMATFLVAILQVATGVA